MAKAMKMAPVYTDITQPKSVGGQIADAIFSGAARVLAVLLVCMLFAVLFSLIVESWPAIGKFGLGFVTSTEWDPVNQDFGAWPAIVGTLVTSFLALLIGVPISFGIAIFITDIAPKRVASVLARMIELMAGIPSIIFGMWGLFVLAPFMARHIQPPIMEAFMGVPLLGTIFGPPPIGIGVFTASLILALMVIPLITSVMRDVFTSIPPVAREAAYGVGCTRFEVVSLVLVPYGRIGLLGGIILGLGRALGETMAVTFVIGNAHSLFSSLFQPGTTISATIANEFTEATGTMYPAALMYLGVILFVTTVIVLVISRLLTRSSAA